ncbi:hypothetical protein BGX33_003952 [Mortierella sp. NVP41]|nr:hypothetical protein BGX33_003952 [Mortierella sp. NVP41]
MVQVRRFHSNVLFFIPLTQGVLLIIILDFCKNTVFFANQVQNLEPMVTTTLPDGSKGQSRKDPAYLTAQYVYAFWLLSMALKAIVGFRANLKFNLRWMGIYNVLFGMDTAFEFVHKTLGVIFQDMTALNDAEIIRHYTIGFLILLIQCYGFFCVWMHQRWVMSEMPHLMNEDPPMSFLRLMFPMAYSRSNQSATAGAEASAAIQGTIETGAGAGIGTGTIDPRTMEEGSAHVPLAPTQQATTAVSTTTTITETP